MKILMASASFFAKICTSLRSVLKFFNAHHSRFAYVLHMAPKEFKMHFAFPAPYEFRKQIQVSER